MPPIQTFSNSGSVPGPDDITRVELPNGITVLARPNFYSPSVVIKGYLQTGALCDPPDKIGLADFVATALMRGTAKREFQSLYDALESVGASMGFSGATHTTGFSAKSLAEDLDLLLELFTEILQYPAFPIDQVERLRAQLLTSLSLRAQNTAAMAAMTFDDIVYKHHPYRFPEEGYPETIQAISVDDLIDFQKQHYGPRGMAIIIVGGIDPQEAIDKVAAALGAWQNPDQIDIPELPPLEPVKKGVTERVEIAGKSQSDLVIGTAGPRRSAPEYMAAAIGNNILGRFGLMGRIGDSVREKAGLAYYAYSGMGGGLGPGPWTVAAGVDPSNEEKAIDLIRKEIERFVSELVSAEELENSQSSYIGRLPLSLESNSGVAGAILNIERHQLGMDYLQRYPAIVSAVTREQVLEAAAKYLKPDKLIAAVAGPPREAS